MVNGSLSLEGVGVWRVLIDLLLYPWAMARRKTSKTMKRSKIEPAALTLTFATVQSEPGVRLQNWIDLSQVASIVNRRFYRQGLNWAVAGFKVSSLQTGAVNVTKLPNTWVLSNAWTKARAVWERMNNEALAETESIRPRFLDFKVYADVDHHLAGFGNNLLPVAIGPGGAGNVAIPGEWESSKVIMPAADPLVAGSTAYSRELIALGASFPGVGASGLDAVSLIEGYAASRLLPNVLDPNAPDDAVDAAGILAENWMAAIFNDGTTQDEQVIGDMITENNIAPYPFENDGINPDTMYPGGANQLSGLEYHDFVTIYAANATDGVGIQRLKGGNFPCGLMSIDWTPSIGAPAANLLIQIDLVPGHHRGYLAEPMQDM